MKEAFTDVPDVMNQTGGGYGSPWRQDRTSVSLAQFVAFIVGLSLTIALYAVFNWVSSNIVEKNQKQVASFAYGQVSKAVDEVFLALDLGADSLMLQQGGRLSARYSTEDVERIGRYFANTKIISTVVYYNKSADNVWRGQNLYSRETVTGVSVKDLGERLSGIKALEKLDSESSTLFFQAPYSDYDIRNLDPQIYDRPFYVVRSLSSGAEGANAFLVATGNFSDYFTEAWFEANSGVKALMFKMENEPIPLYSMQISSYKPEAIYRYYRRDEKVVAADYSFRFSVAVGNDLYTGLVAKMPFIVLFCCLALTVLSTLFLRGRQQQAYRLQSINNMLARKNYDLNMEVSKRGKLDLEIRKSEREYKAVLDTISDAIFEISSKGQILFLNKSWEGITGYSSRSMAGKDLFMYIHPDDRVQQRKNLKEMIAGERHAYRVFTRVRTADDTYRAVEMAISMLRKDENHKLRVVGSFTDVEEYRKAEKALSEAEKKYEAMVNNAAGGIYQISPEGRFISANPAMARILKLPRVTDLINSAEIVHDRLYIDSVQRKKFLASLVNKADPQNYEGRVRLQDGSVIWVRENVRAVCDNDGALMYYEGSMEDITERREAEIKLREAMVQSDLSNRAKTEFLANMSHELRTPLNSIIGFSEIIKDEVLGPLENKNYGEYAKDIYESGKNLLQIINDILDVSHIEAGEKELSEGVVNVAEVVKACVGFMENKAKQNGLVMANMVEDSTPKIIGDTTALKQIMLNLLSNAIKFTPHDGHVTIGVDLDDDQCLRIAVTDTGVGLDETEIEKALSPFGQVYTGLDRKSSGLGLGLTLVNSLIRLHGGELEIFSQKGVGTTVTVIFPRDRVVIQAVQTDKKGKGGEERNKKDKITEA